MVVRCEVCGWESDHGYTFTELQTAITQYGGKLEGINEDHIQDMCPTCKLLGSLEVVNED